MNKSVAISMVLLASVLVIGAPVIPAAAAGGQAPGPGTVITAQNWQQYKDYMTVTLQQMFMSTNRTTRVSPQATISIGPTVSYPMGDQYWAATEKYGKQVRLVKVSSGGYSMEGYVGGMPFKDLSPDDPLAGYKLMYDNYFQYFPPIMHVDGARAYAIDQYGNVSLTIPFIWVAALMHLTDAGYPPELPFAKTLGDAYLVHYGGIVVPEQLKYTAALNITWDDPNKMPGSYAFVPSIRRVIQLSQSARCSPFQGADYSLDDEQPVPLPTIWFQAKFVGLKKILYYITPDDPAMLKAATDRKNYYDGAFPPFPKPEVLGKWQLRDTYVLEMKRLPAFAPGYCYAERLTYLDAETQQEPFWDTWDQNGKFWRGEVQFLVPQKKAGGGYFTQGPGWTGWKVDLQNNHMSLLLPPEAGTSTMWINQNTPKQFVNYSRYATPAGLYQVVQ